MNRSAAALLLFAVPTVAESVPIDVQRSSITIHVGKSGLLSAAGHEHTINAPISSGMIEESPTPQVEFVVRTTAMTVQADPKVDPKTHAQIQKDMEEMTLETSKFSEIRFKSSRIDQTPNGQWKVQGDLSLHGVTKPVSLVVSRTGEAYTARTTLKQTDFGIKPISVAGGTIKVKNEVEIEFQILAPHR